MSPSFELGTLPEPLKPEHDHEGYRAMARAADLREIGVRPKLFPYIKSVWSQRAFIGTLASSKAYAKNKASYLGQLWTILNPTLNALVYILLFGFLMDTKRGMENVISFIVTGTFIYGLFQHTATGGAKSIDSNLGLVRSMRFPRAVLPLSTATSELVSFLPGSIVMLVISFVSELFVKEHPAPISWRWLFFPVALALYAVFLAGCSLLFARLATGTPDIANTLPFFLRMFMYVSGVIFSIPVLVKNHALAMLLEHQPVAVFLYLFRMCILEEPTVPFEATKWLWALAWAVGVFVVGFILFWTKEEKYGRD